MSRRAWLLFLILGLTVVASLGLFQVLLRQVEADQLFGLEERLTSTGQTLALALADDLRRGDVQAIEALIISNQEAGQTRIRVLNAHRHLIADSYGPVNDQESLRFRPEIQAAYSGRYGAYTRFADENERSLALFVATPVFSGDKVVGAVYVSRSTDAILQRLGILRRSFQGALIAMTAVIFVGALWLTRNFSQDLQRLGQVSELADFHPEAGDQVERVSQSLGFLVESLRSKVTQLEDERDKTRRFVEDIAHELKTPVTGLQGAVEAMKASLPEHQMFANIERETERLARLTTLLLELRKLEYYQLKPRLFDLVSLVDTILESFRHGTSRVIVEDLPEECPMLGDPNKIQRVVENLVENALRCAPEQTEVTVRVRADETHVTISVADLGPGVSEQDARQIFGRGERGQGPIGHLGLGLAIAAQIVELHHGEFGLQADRPQGAEFYVRLPRSTALPSAV